MRYRLIREYPGSPPLGSIAEPFQESSIRITLKTGTNYYKSSSSGNYFKELIEDQPEYWIKLKELDESKV